MWRTDSLEKTDAGKDWRQEEKGQQSMRWLDDITSMMDMSLKKLCGLVMDRKPGVLQSMGVTKSQTRLSDWTELSRDFLKTTLNEDFTGNMGGFRDCVRNSEDQETCSSVVWSFPRAHTPDNWGDVVVFDDKIYTIMLYYPFASALKKYLYHCFISTHVWTDSF